MKNKKLSINLAKLKNINLKIKLTELLGENKLVTIDTNKAEFAIIEDNKEIIVKNIAEGSILSTLEKPVTIEQLNTTIRQYAQSDFIRNITLNNDNYQVKLEMIPVIVEFNSNGEEKN